MPTATSVKILRAKLAYRAELLNRFDLEETARLQKLAKDKVDKRKAATIERNRLKEIKRIYVQRDNAILRKKAEVARVQENRLAKNLARIAATAERRTLRKAKQS